MENSRVKIILSSIFFVLGFSVVFSVLGVALQSVLGGFAYDAKNILNYIAGLIIIVFGLLLTGLINIDFLQREHKLKLKKTNHAYLTSFLFGGAFAVGWTPCVGAVLGAVLTLAATNPGAALPMMLAYSLGLGLPFIIAAIFISQATSAIEKISPYLKTINLVFGLVIVVLGILIFTNSLNLVANIIPVENLLMGDAGASTVDSIEPNLIIAFIAGLVSFLNPCVLPLVPAYLTFIAGTTLNEAREKK
ncbi:MAG TPA: cytochrome c biogenesis protein CcdA [archaeon]|nr:cytochrome c biogenesis protein CcdA [archaeon]